MTFIAFTKGFSLNFSLLSLADTSVPPTYKPDECKVIFTELLLLPVHTVQLH